MKNSKLRRKKPGGKTAAALAIAVSLWLAGGGVALAGGDLYIDRDDDNKLIRNGDKIPSGATVSPDIGSSTTTMTVKGGEWYDWYFCSGDTGEAEHDVKNYTADLSSLKGRITVHGGNIKHNAEVSGNLVRGTNIDTEGLICGGVMGVYGQGLNNTILLTESKVQGGVFGSASFWPILGQIVASASNNTIVLDRTEIQDAGKAKENEKGVVGGLAGVVKGNTITMNSSTVGGTVSGGYAGILNEGHTLNLFGANTAGSVVNFATMKVQDTWTMPDVNGVKGPTFNLAWSEDAPLLTAGRFKDCDTLDIADATVLTNHTDYGTMALLQSGTDNNFKGLKLKYADGKVTFDDTVKSQVIKSGTEAKKIVKGVTLGYNKDTHTVALADNGKKVNYIVGDKYTSATFGRMNWTDGGYTFAAPDTIDPEGLAVSFAKDFKVAGAENQGNGETLTLLDLSSTVGTIKNSDSRDVTVHLPETAVREGLKFAATRTDTAAATAGAQKVLYTTGAKSKVATATLTGPIAWDTKTPYYDAKDTAYTFDGETAIDLAGLTVTGTTAENPMNQSMVLIANAADVTGDHLTISPTGYGTISVDYTNDEKIRFGATADGTVEVAENNVNYKINKVEANKIDLASWTGAESAIPEGWTAQQNIPVATDGLDVPDELLAGGSRTILTAAGGTFSDENISGQNAYRTVSGSSTKNGVTITGTGERGVRAEQGENGASKLVYRSADLLINGVSVGEVTFTANDTLRKVSNDRVFYDGVKADFSGFAVANPTEAGAGESMTLLEANASLADMAEQTKTQAYSVTPVQGLSVDAALTGSVSVKNHNAVYRATNNSAQTISFGSVAWKNGGTLFNHADKLSKVSFDGATVNTSNITFAPGTDLSRGGQMTLIKNYDATPADGLNDKPGSIVGNVYYVGTAVQGEGAAAMDGNNLVFKAAGPPDTPQPQTHRTLMAGLVGMAALSSGNEFIDAATDGLSLDSNTGADSVSIFAKMGGSKKRQITGSHIDVHTWNAILALGHKNEKEKSSFKYGAFFEYGTGNYTTIDGADRGDGSLYYTGGGLLAKWAANHGFYVEGSLRAGSVHNNSRSVLREANGTPHSFETNTPYFGAHIGVGKEIALKNGDSVDVYGKYFYNRRNSTSFNAGGQFDLDAVTSQVLSVGARYTVKREKWDFYVGAAYEHELDGEARGKANGLSIRSADVGGGSARVEIGATMKPGAKSPWSLDLNLSGFAGKKRGVSGGMYVEWMF